MVEIEYYKDPMEDATQICESETVGEWVRNNFSDKSELHDLRFFVGSMLGEEIDVTNVNFLKIDSGTIVVTHDSAIPRDLATIGYLVVSLVVSLVVVALQPEPKVPDSSLRNQNSATNSLGGRSNEPRINQRIDDIFGFVSKHTPPLIQFPYRRYVNNQEKEFLCLCVGRGRYQLQEDAVFDGETLISKIPDSAISFYNPYTSPNSGDTPFLKIGQDITEPLYNVSESNEISASTELQPPNDLDIGQLDLYLNQDGGIESLVPESLDWRNQFKVGDKIKFKDLKSYTFNSSVELPPVDPEATIDLYTRNNIDGEYELTAVGEKNMVVAIPPSEQFKWNFYSTGTPAVTKAWQYINNTNLYAITEPTLVLYYFTEINTGNPSIEGIFTGDVGPVSIPKGTERVIINVVAPNGCYETDGNDYKITVDYEYLIEELDETGSKTGNSTPYPFSISSNPDNTRAQAAETHDIEVPYEISQITGKRTTNRNKSGSVSAVDEVFWKNLYFANRITDNDFGDVTIAQCIISANSTSLGVKDRKVNMDVERMITYYQGNGIFGEKESYPTSNFAQILIHQALDKYIGRLSLSDINADGLLQVSEQIIDYFGSESMVKFGYDFDSDDLTFEETFAMIANVVNCIGYTQSGVFDLFFERAQSESSKLITHRNKIPGGEKRNVSFVSKKNYNGVELTYRSEKTAIDEVIYIPEDQSATNPEKIEVPGCITYEQAYKRAQRIRNKQIYSYISHIFDCDEFGRIILPGERIDSPDGTRFTERSGVENGYRVYDGEVLEVTGMKLELSQPVKFTNGETHIIQFTKANGDNSEMISCVRGDDDFSVILSTLPTESIYDGYSKDKTKFIFASEQARQALPLLVQTVESSNDDSQEINTISCINYSDNYYKNDKDTINV